MAFLLRINFTRGVKVESVARSLLSEKLRSTDLAFKVIITSLNTTCMRERHRLFISASQHQHSWMSIRIDGRCYTIRIGSVMYELEHTDARHLYDHPCRARGMQEVLTRGTRRRVKRVFGGRFPKPGDVCVCLPIHFSGGGAGSCHGYKKFQ